MTNGSHGSKRALALFGIVVFSVVSGVSSSGQNGSRSDLAFPDSEGTYWIYRGIARWTHQNSNNVGQAPVTWKMQLEKVIRRSNLTAFVLNGFPDGLDWSDGTARPTDSLIIQTADRLYRIESQTVAVALKSLDNPDENVAGLLKDDDLFLQLPLYRGPNSAMPNRWREMTTCTAGL